MALRLHTPETRAAASQRSLAIVIFCLALVLAAVVRLIGLSDRPMHTDESVQAQQVGYMLGGDSFTYNPRDGHGPVLVYSTLPIAWLSGAKSLADLSEWQLRLVPALFGLLLFLFLPLLTDGLGRLSIALGAVFIAISPMMVFYSRYYIMEVPLMCLTTAAIAFGWRYAQSRHLGWLIGLGVMVGLMHATKETFVFSVAAGLAAMVFSAILSHFLGAGQLGLVYKGGKRPEPPAWHFLLPIGIAALVSMFVFSGGFKLKLLHHIQLSLTTYLDYFHRGSEGAGHAKPFWYYLSLLGISRDGLGRWWGEPVVLILALIGVLRSIFPAPLSFGKRPGDPRFQRWLTGYVLFLILGYSIIPYKTPWTILAAEQGLCLLAGLGAASILQAGLGLGALSVAWVGGLLGLGHLGWQVKQGLGATSADPANPLVYSHTSPAFLSLVQRIREQSPQFGGGEGVVIQVVHPELAFPLPWYLRDIPSVNYLSAIDEMTPEGEKKQAAFLKLLPKTHFVVCADDPNSPLPTILAKNFVQETHELRHGVLISLYTRKPATLQPKQAAANSAPATTPAPASTGEPKATPDAEPEANQTPTLNPPAETNSVPTPAPEPSPAPAKPEPTTEPNTPVLPKPL